MENRIDTLKEGSAEDKTEEEDVEEAEYYDGIEEA